MVTRRPPALSCVVAMSGSAWRPTCLAPEKTVRTGARLSGVNETAGEVSLAEIGWIMHLLVG
jgi:hypothetical protein